MDGEVVLDLRDDDRGVMLVLINAFTGVDKSSRVVPALIVGGALLRTGFGVLVVVAAVYCPASRGVIGDLTFRVLASAGIRGRVEFCGCGCGCWKSLDLFCGGGMVRTVWLFSHVL